MGNGINLLGGRHLLQALGLDPLFFRQLEQFDDQLGALCSLQDQFQMACGGLSPLALAALLQGGIPGSCTVLPPNPGLCSCPQNYAQPQTFDFGATSAPPLTPEALMGRMHGAMFERFLHANPYARQQFEMAMGGRIIPDGSRDGRITIMPFSGGYFPAGGGNPYASAMGMFDALNRAALSTGIAPSLSQGVYQAAMLGALGQMVAQRAQSSGSPYVDWFGDPNDPRNQYLNQLAALGGGGGGPFQPGQWNPTQPAFAMGPSDGSDTSAVLNDPSLTVEDKVCLLIMLIMKQMDKEIERQAQYIDQLQKQQNKSGGGGKGGKGGGGGGGSDKSIDVETMKLKRLIDKRSQMFDMLRQIIDKYNQTAKGIIDSIGR
jgi:hypothetical protein